MTTESTQPTVPLDPPAAPADGETLPLPDVEPAVAPEVAAATAATLPAPRVRWAGIVWGAVLAGVAASALWLLADPSHYAPIRAWLITLSPESFNPGVIVGVVILVVGVLLLIGGGVALLRRAQLRATLEP